MDLSAGPSAVAEPDSVRLRLLASFRDNGRFPAVAHGRPSTRTP
ncbi:hypothetical protein [Streptomyces cyaneofuscatus]